MTTLRQLDNTLYYTAEELCEALNGLVKQTVTAIIDNYDGKITADIKLTPYSNVGSLHYVYYCDLLTNITYYRGTERFVLEEAEFGY